MTTPPAAAVPQGLSATLSDAFSREFAGNSLRAWAVALATIVVIHAAFWIARRVLKARLERIAASTATRWDDVLVAVLADIRFWCILFIALDAGTHPLVLSATVAKVLRGAAVVAVALQLLLSSRLVIEETIRHLLTRSTQPDGTPDPSLASATTIIRFMATLLIGSILILLALANLNVEITPLITGLGIGGIAIALAAQSVLGDLFASLAILFDKPFLVGQAINVGDKVGIVEQIGIKSTRVRSLSGEIMVYRNTDLLASRIHNFSTMKERRIVTVIGIICETPTDKILRFVEIVKDAVRSQQSARLDRCHFRSIGAYSLDIECVYFILSPDYAQFMDIQQAINLRVLDHMRREGIELAYPTALEIQRQEPAASPAAVTPSR
ncbi:MAG: mechanosensitive ion channel family protein [Phycisphaerales bacterium]|nr:mechanosensitive ion channel family protein [Phycisphaerales bacterium]